MFRLAAMALTALLAACSGAQTTATPSVAFVGDSITENWFWQGPPECKTDPSCVHLIPSNVPFLELGFGVGGNTTAQMLARFGDVLAASPNVVVIDGGVNDLHNGLPFTVTNIAAMAYAAKASGVRVIIASVMLQQSPYWPSNIGPSVSQVDAFNDQLLALCAEHGYLYADYRDAMLMPDGTQDLSLYMDGLHPNAAGYEKMWEVLLPLIEEEL